MNRFLVVPLALATFLLATPASAQRSDTLLVDRAAASQDINGPNRGALMSQVEAQFGAPMEKLEPRGGQQPQWPVIRRWVYPGYIVYFENDHVIDVVVRRAAPGEIGPKPID